MPINPLIGAAAIGVGGNLFGNLFGGPKTNAAVPGDLRQLRGGQIDLLNQLLQPGGQGIRNFFGPLTAPRTGIEQFLAQPAPETQAFNTARPILEGMLTGTGPQFERDIAGANQQGGRFGSANAILRGEALRNLFNLRNQTAGTLGLLAGQAGQAPFNRLMAGFGVADLENQRLQALLGGQLGAAQQIAFGLPLQQQPNIGQAFGGAGMDLASLLGLLGIGGGQAGGGGQGGMVGGGGSWLPGYTPGGPAGGYFPNF